MAKNSTAPTISQGQLEIAEFKGKEIRKVLLEDEWYFSVVDVVKAVVEPASPSRYWNELKGKLIADEGFSDLFEKIERVKMPVADGKSYSTDAANTETMFRIIQSIPSKKAEPFKRWLASKSRV